MATILDGKAVARKILDGVREELARIPRKFSLAVVLAGADPVVARFVAQKKKAAGELGVDFRTYEYEASISTNELRKRIAVIAHEADPDGIIVQLPLPSHINTQHILNAVPPEKDVDVLSARAVGDFVVGRSPILPPVVGGVKALFEGYGIEYQKRYVVIVGAGELVGRPLAAWFLNERATFSVVRSTTPDISEFTRRADSIVTGVGKPGLITGEMVKDGVVVIDAGTSESADPSNALGTGKVAGDVDFESVAPKASFITPVPGGVGPLTVAMIYRNLLTLIQAKR